MAAAISAAFCGTVSGIAAAASLGERLLAKARARRRRRRSPCALSPRHSLSV
jgi:hypothetical protein